MARGRPSGAAYHTRLTGGAATPADGAARTCSGPEVFKKGKIREDDAEHNTRKKQAQSRRIKVRLP